jgi:hypothetical protein
MDQYFGGSHVGGDGDVPQIAQPDERCILFPRLCGEGVPEKEDQIYLIEGYPGTNLLVSAKSAVQVTVYGKSGGFTHQFSRGGGRADVVAGKDPAVSYAKLYHQFFFCLMGYQCYIHILSEQYATAVFVGGSCSPLIL